MADCHVAVRAGGGRTRERRLFLWDITVDNRVTYHLILLGPTHPAPGEGDAIPSPVSALREIIKGADAVERWQICHVNKISSTESYSEASCLRDRVGEEGDGGWEDDKVVVL